MGNITNKHRGLTPEMVRKHFSYDPITGVFMWRNTAWSL